MSKRKDTHWWYRGRREILSRVLGRYFPMRKADILEVSCGTGENIPLLQTFGKVYASEYDSGSISYVREAYRIPVEKGVLPYEIPFSKNFDMICLLDVLEHIELHIETLRELEKRLNPGGYLLITVPAYPWLFGPHDKLCGHFRRYAKRDLVVAVDQCISMKVIYATYFNMLLFPLVLAARLMDKITNRHKGVSPFADSSLTENRKICSDYNISKGLINSILYAVFRLEQALVKRGMSLPFGSSVLLLCRKAE